MNSIHPFLRGALALAPLRPAFWLQGELATGNRAVRRWLSGEEAPPLGIAEQMVILLRARAKEADEAANLLEILIATGSLRKSERVESATMRNPPATIGATAAQPSSTARDIERAHRKRLGLNFDE